jgi:hypothetical protein
MGHTCDLTLRGLDPARARAAESVCSLGFGVYWRGAFWLAWGETRHARARADGSANGVASRRMKRSRWRSATGESSVGRTTSVEPRRLEARRYEVRTSINRPGRSRCCSESQGMGRRNQTQQTGPAAAEHRGPADDPECSTAEARIGVPLRRMGTRQEWSSPLVRNYLRRASSLRIRSSPQVQGVWGLLTPAGGGTAERSRNAKRRLAFVSAGDTLRPLRGVGCRQPCSRKERRCLSSGSRL